MKEKRPDKQQKRTIFKRAAYSGEVEENDLKFIVNCNRGGINK